MARPLRIEYEGAFYHIIQRGLERRSIFRGDRNKERFLQYLSESHFKYNLICHAYCLMDNHYHLIIQTPKANIAQIMHYINASYVMYYNKKHKRNGPLYQGRYKSFLVEADEYLYQLSRYIHLNPIRAKIVGRPEDYGWSSYVYFIRKEKPKKWLETNFISSSFASSAKKARRAYEDFVLAGIQKEKLIKNYITENTHKGLVLGSMDFAQEIYERYIKGRKDEDVPAIRSFAKYEDLNKERVENIIKQFAKDDIRIRKLTIYILRKYTQMTLKEIAAYYDGVGKTGISIMCKRLEDERQQDKNLDRLISRIEKACNVET
jgi:putative transposase